MLTPLIAANLTALLLAITDQRTGKMPNWITLPSLFIALGTHTIFGERSAGLQSLLGLFVVGVVPLVLFLVTKGDAIGGGDVKALGALGAWVGPTLGLELTFLSFSLLALFAVSRSALRGELLALLVRSLRLAKGTSPKKEALTVRFGPFLAAGTLLCSLAAAISNYLTPLALLF